MARSQVTSSAIAFPARPNVAASSRCARSQPAALRQLGGVRGHDESRPVVEDDLQRAACVRRGQNRLLGEERLERHHAVVLVLRRVVDGEAAAVEIRELGVGHATGKASTAVEPASASELLETAPVGTVSGDHDLERGVERGSLEQEIDALRAVEAVHREDEVAVAVAAVLELLRWRREELRVQSRRALEAVCDVLRDREEPGCLAERDAVERVHLPAQRAILRRLVELPEVGAVELVRLPELVDEPDALLRVPHEVRGKLGRDHHVHRSAVHLLQVEHPPQKRLSEDARARIPLERDRDELGLVAAQTKLVDQTIGHDLGPAPRERDLRPGDQNPHRRPLRSTSTSASSRSTCCCRSSISRSEAALNERWS